MSIANIHLLPKEEQDRLLGRKPEEPEEEKKEEKTDGRRSKRGN